MPEAMHDAAHAMSDLFLSIATQRAAPRTFDETLAQHSEDAATLVTLAEVVVAYWARETPPTALRFSRSMLRAMLIEVMDDDPDRIGRHVASAVIEDYLERQRPPTHPVAS